MFWFVVQCGGLLLLRFGLFLRLFFFMFLLVLWLVYSCVFGGLFLELALVTLVDLFLGLVQSGPGVCA